MSDIECPYCKEDQEIDHDDGYGYEEDELHQQECPHCFKYFTYTTSIMYYYESHKADCLNGAEHKWREVANRYIFRDAGRYKCDICNEQKLVILERVQYMRDNLNKLTGEKKEWAMNLIKEYENESK